MPATFNVEIQLCNPMLSHNKLQLLGYVIFYLGKSGFNHCFNPILIFRIKRKEAKGEKKLKNPKVELFIFF